MISNHIIAMYDLRLTDVLVDGVRCLYKFPDRFEMQVFLTDRHINGNKLPEYKFLIVLIDDGCNACFLIDELYLENRFDITMQLINQEIERLKIPFSLN